MKINLLLFAGLLFVNTVSADIVDVEIKKLTAAGTGESIGSITFNDAHDGLAIKFDVGGLTPGLHGIHVHENANCGPGTKDGKTVPGLAAGGHYDPQHSGHHGGPKGKGHLGDLPAMKVNEDGWAIDLVVAPHLKVKDMKGRAIIIHAGGDNYSDAPAKLGGGGARVACGLVK